MSESQMKKMKHSIEKVARKRDRKMLRAAVRRGARPTKNFQAAVAKAVVQAKAKDSGFVDHDGVSTAGLTSAVGLPASIDTPGEVVFIGGCTQGASENQHPNKKFLLKSYQLRGRVANQGSASYNNFSIVMVLDTDPQGTVPAVTDIFKAVSGSPSVVCMLNPQTSARFRILARRNYTLNGPTADVNGALFIDEYFDLKKIEVVTKSATSDIGSIQKNALLAVFIGSHVSGTTSTGANLIGRLRFIDI